MAEGQAFVLLGEQWPLSCPQIIRSAGGEPTFELPWADKLPAALDVLLQDIPAGSGDAATAGKAWRGGTVAQTSLGKGSGDLPGPRE